MKNKKIMWFVLMISTMAVIFYFSAQTGETSKAVGNVVAQTMNIKPDVRWRTPANTPLLFGLGLRKWAHVFLYTCLGITALGYFRRIVPAGTLCYIYAVLDEIHQLFLEGRTATFKDTLLDECGFFLALVIWGVLIFAFKRVKKLSLSNKYKKSKSGRMGC